MPPDGAFPHTACIALGANLGSREENLRAALAKLAALPSIRVAAVSSFIETAAVGGPLGQPAYLNGAAVLHTSLAPRALLDTMLAIEKELGRDRRHEERHGPRTLDLDLLLYNDLILNEPGLTLPHPRLHQRAFVLRPLAELTPEWIHPGLNKTMLQLRNELLSHR